MITAIYSESLCADVYIEKLESLEGLNGDAGWVLRTSSEILATNLSPRAIKLFQEIEKALKKDEQ